MENASKALIMAGGLLIVVMIISIAMFVLTSARGIADESNKQLEANAIASYNRFYESYGNEIRGIDVLNIYNKTIDDKNRITSIRTADFSPSIASYITNLKKPEGVKYMDDIYSYKPMDSDSDGYIDTLQIAFVREVN